MKKALAKTDLLQLLVRYLLWESLNSGRSSACVEMTNQGGYLDSLELQILIPDGKDCAALTVHFADPESGSVDSLDSRIFWPGILGWPDKPQWGEFSFGRVWPNPLAPEDDYEFEQLVEGDSPGEWPSLLEGAGYLHWAVLGLAEQGHIADLDLVEFLRAQDGLSAIGDVEVVALQERRTHEGVFPFAVDSVINLLSELRAGGKRAQRASQREDDKAIARVLVEPWLMITPGVPEEIIRFIASDPSCPALVLTTKDAGLPLNSSKSVQERGDAALPDEWEIRTGVTGVRPRLEASNRKARSVKGLLSASDSSAAAARDQLSASIERIAVFVPEPIEDADDESLEGLVGRHLQYLQARVWLNGGVSVPERMIKAWVRRLDAFADLVEEGDDEEVGAAAYGSWSVYGK